MSRSNQEMQAGLAHVATNRSTTNALPMTPHTVRRVGIVGANATGIGIAMSLLDADIPVTVFELERATLGEGIATVRSAYAAAVSQGRLAAASRDRRMGLLAGTINFHHLKDCDLVIEAVSTEPGIKAELFRRLDQTVKPGAILVSCTSPGKVDHLAGATRRAGEVFGLQLSSPAHVGETWTLIPGKASAGPSLASVVGLAQHLGKACVVSGSWSGDAGLDTSTRPWDLDQAVE